VSSSPKVFARHAAVPNLSPSQAAPLVELPTLQSIRPKLTSTLIGLDAPLLPFANPRLDSRVFMARDPEMLENASVFLSWALALLQRTPTRRAAAEDAHGKPCAAAPPMRFMPLQRIPTQSSRYLGFARDSHTRAPCAFRFSQPPDAFGRPMPAGRVSDQIRSWGFPFRALLLPRSSSLSPTPMPS
jgi:hypothetical protein